MSRLRLVFIISVVILAVLIGSIMLRPLATGAKYSEVQKEQLLQTEDAWIIEFKIMNREGEDKNYTITGLIGDKSYSENVLIPDGRRFTHIHHIYPDRIIGGKVSFAIYKEGEDIPFEQITYYLDSN